MGFGTLKMGLGRCWGQVQDLADLREGEMAFITK
jgi:hypothetical protein